MPETNSQAKRKGGKIFPHETLDMVLFGSDFYQG